MSKKSAAAAEKALREAASTFRSTLMEAKDAGLAVTWPRSAEELVSMQISTTGAALKEEEIAEIAAAEAKAAGAGTAGQHRS